MKAAPYNRGMAKSNKPKATLPDPASIPAFDKVMRGLVRVPKAEVDALITNEQKTKKRMRK